MRPRRIKMENLIIIPSNLIIKSVEKKIITGTGDAKENGENWDFPQHLVIIRNRLTLR